jgi:predicted nuclease with TOPRIM domain
MENEYDSGQLYPIVRKRYHELQDRVRKLMSRESALEEGISKADDKITHLRTTIQWALKASADTSDLQRMARETEMSLGRDRDEYDAIQEELRLVREALKFTDMAHEGLHWACFAEQNLADFDRETAQVGETLQVAD